MVNFGSLPNTLQQKEGTQVRKLDIQASIADGKIDAVVDGVLYSNIDYYISPGGLCHIFLPVPSPNHAHLYSMQCMQYNMQCRDF